MPRSLRDTRPPPLRDWQARALVFAGSQDEGFPDFLVMATCIQRGEQLGPLTRDNCTIEISNRFNSAAFITSSNCLLHGAVRLAVTAE